MPDGVHLERVEPDFLHLMTIPSFPRKRESRGQGDDVPLEVSAGIDPEIAQA
jgi:hypothetical protein